MNSFSKTMKAIATSFAFTGALLASAAVAQEYPAKPVTLVIPFGPGGSNDTYGRVIGEQLAKLWNQTVIVENRPGAGSAIGSAHVAEAKPDGHTLLFVSTSYTTTAATQIKLPFDPLKDLEPVGIVADADLYMMTGKRVTIKNLDDLTREAKAQTIFSGAPGIGSISHLTQLLLNDTLGIKTEIVQHTSGGNVMADMGGERLDTYFGVVFEANSGTVTPVVVMSDKRSDALPNVPTIGELGYPQAKSNLWFGIFAPTGTPTEIVAKINKDIITVMKNPEQAEFLKAQGLKVSGATPAEFASQVYNDIGRWTALAEKYGLRK